MRQQHHPVMHERRGCDRGGTRRLHSLRTRDETNQRNGLDREDGVAGVPRQRGGKQQANKWRGECKIAQFDRRVVEYDAEQQQPDWRRGSSHDKQPTRLGRHNAVPAQYDQCDQTDRQNGQRHSDGGPYDAMQIKRQSTEQVGR